MKGSDYLSKEIKDQTVNELCYKGMTLGKMLPADL